MRSNHQELATSFVGWLVLFILVVVAVEKTEDLWTANAAEWLGAIGTLMAVIIALFPRYVESLTHAPRLKLTFEPRPPFVCETGWEARTGPKNLFVVQGCEIWFRLRVDNIGNAAASNVEVVASSLYRMNEAGVFEEIPRIVPTPLSWTSCFTDGGPETRMRSIPAGTSRFCDLFQAKPEGHDFIVDHWSGQVRGVCELAVVPRPLDESAKLVGGHYRLGLIVVADNFGPEKVGLDVRCGQVPLMSAAMCMDQGFTVAVLRENDVAAGKSQMADFEEV